MYQTCTLWRLVKPIIEMFSFVGCSGVHAKTRTLGSLSHDFLELTMTDTR